MSEPTTTPETSSSAQPKQRCRFIKTGGEQCRVLAMSEHDFCWHHRWYRKPRFTGVKGYDRVGLLEDEASIQLFISQAMQGVVDGTLSESRGRTLFHGANAATAVIRLQFQRERWRAETKQQPEEPVREATNLDCDPLAPPQEYRGPDGQFEPYWSFSKYMYEQQCQKEGRPKPTSPADMPPSGWMDEEEYFEDPAEWTKRYDEKIKAAREQAAAAPSATTTEGMTTEPTAAESPTPSPQNNGCHPEERSDEGPCVLPEAKPDPDTHSVDLQAAAVPERSKPHAQRSSEPWTPDPCVSDQRAGCCVQKWLSSRSEARDLVFASPATNPRRSVPPFPSTFFTIKRGPEPCSPFDKTQLSQTRKHPPEITTRLRIPDPRGPNPSPCKCMRDSMPEKLQQYAKKGRGRMGGPAAKGGTVEGILQIPEKEEPDYRLVPMALNSVAIDVES